jgi:hypothetical protein
VCYEVQNYYLFIACTDVDFMKSGRWPKCVLRVCFWVKGVKGYVVGKGRWVEGGDNLLQYCYVGYVLRIILNIMLFVSVEVSSDHLCGLVVRVPVYRSRGPGFDSQRYQIFWEVVGLERGPLRLMRITEAPLEWKNSGSESRKPRLKAVGIRCADHMTPSIRKSWH